MIEVAPLVLGAPLRQSSMPSHIKSPLLLFTVHKTKYGRRLPFWARPYTSSHLFFVDYYCFDLLLTHLFSRARPHSHSFFLFQLADEGASSPFHPFKDFLGRLGISVSPPELLPPSPPRGPQRVPQELLDKINKQLAEGTFCSDMDSSSSPPRGHYPPQPSMAANP